MWERGNVSTYDGKECKRQLLIEKQGTFQQLIDELSYELAPLARHLFIARWQYRQFSKLSQNVPTNWLVTIGDFSENYRCAHQDEISSAYYQYQQATLYPVVAYYQCPDCSEAMVQEAAVAISPDLGHDAFAVRQFNKTLGDHLKSWDITFDHEVQFSDGCTSQFKSKQSFKDLSEMVDPTFERVYFGSRHGKGPCDGLGGIIKKCAETYVKSRKGMIRNAEELFKFCQQYMTIGTGTLPIYY
jgi:hypothetical protein